MGLITALRGWFGTPATPPKAPPNSRPPGAAFASSQYPASQFPASQQAPQSQQAVRKDLLRMVLRDTLQRNGIPTTWLVADALHATSRGREPGLHMRLVVKHWDARLMEHAPSLQDNFEKRLFSMDPLAANWLMGVSWMFALQDRSACPALPHPGAWTAAPAPAVREPAAPAVAPVVEAGIIEGPTQVHDASSDVRADLERLFALRDEDARLNQTERSFAATEPGVLR